MTALDELRRELELLRWEEDRDGYAYRGPADFVLRHGETFDPAEWPTQHPAGAPRKCFGNAIVLADSLGYTYVEGYALASFRMPVHHAWNVDADGTLIDSTWLNTGLAYLGVRFSTGRADDATWNGDANVLDDFLRDWPVLREPWSGEDWARVWTPSEAILELRSKTPDLERLRSLI